MGSFIGKKDLWCRYCGVGMKQSELRVKRSEFRYIRQVTVAIRAHQNWSR